MIYYCNNSSVTFSYNTLTKECVISKRSGTGREKGKGFSILVVDLSFKSFTDFVTFCKSDKLLDLSPFFNPDMEISFKIVITGKVESEDYTLKKVGSFEYLSNIETAFVELSHIEEEFSIQVNEFEGSLVLSDCNVIQVIITQSTVDLSLSECVYCNLRLQESKITGKCLNDIDLQLIGYNVVKDFLFLTDNVEITTVNLSKQVLENVEFNCNLKASWISKHIYDNFSKQTLFSGSSIADVWFNNCKFLKSIWDYRFVDCVFIKPVFNCVIADCWFEQCLVTEETLIGCDFANNIVKNVFGTIGEILETDTYER